MKDIVKKWIEFAEGDLLTAKDLLVGKSKRYESCVFFCHQSLEKILKATISPALYADALPRHCLQNKVLL